MKLNQRKSALIAIALLALLTVASTSVIRKARDQEVYDRFQSFTELIEKGDHREAYSFMSPAYRRHHTLEEFSIDFDSVTKLTDSWTVTKNFGKLYLCCSDPGVRFAPNSTMTYGIEKNESMWHFTGEADMWLD